MQSLLKLQWHFHQNRTNNPKTGIESQKSSITKIIFGKIKARSITLSDFKLDYRAIVIKAVRFGDKNRHTDQQNRTENRETNSHLYGQLGFPDGKESVCQCKRHEIWVQSLGWEDILEKEMATHLFSCLEKPGRLQSIGSQRVKHDWSNLAHTHVTKCSKTKEIRTYNGEITISSIYGTEKTRQLYAE